MDCTSFGFDRISNLAPVGTNYCLLGFYYAQSGYGGLSLCSLLVCTIACPPERSRVVEIRIGDSTRRGRHRSLLGNSVQHYTLYYTLDFMHTII